MQTDHSYYKLKCTLTVINEFLFSFSQKIDFIFNLFNLFNLIFHSIFLQLHFLFQQKQITEKDVVFVSNY